MTKERAAGAGPESRIVTRAVVLEPAGGVMDISITGLGAECTSRRADGAGTAGTAALAWTKAAMVNRRQAVADVVPGMGTVIFTGKLLIARVVSGKDHGLVDHDVEGEARTNDERRGHVEIAFEQLRGDLIDRIRRRPSSGLPGVLRLKNT